jgi:aminopeptidase
MTPEFERALDAYAQLIIRIGLNLQAGQRLMIRAPLEAAPLVRRVAVHAYDLGSPLVDVIWSDPTLQLVRYQHAPRDSFAETSRWPVAAGLEYAENGDALLSISGVDPDLLKDVEPKLISTVRQAEGRAGLQLSRLISADAINWCVVGYAVAPWAARVFPDLPPDEQQRQLWDAIFKTVRLDTSDPVAAWQAHAADLAARTAMLNEKQYSALHFRGPGTDLNVGLPDNHHWIGGAAPTGVGVENIANLPTEEVFTAPHRQRVDGTVRATMPLNLSGNLIENFSLTFRDGRVVDLQADRGEALLRKQVEMDEGAARLGEVALVPHSSPIAQSGTLFYNTLFDENAASHVALGRAYQNCIAGCKGLDEKDFAALGGNSSITHLDFMIGSGEIDVDGLDADGNREPLMRHGEWAN